jgi:hypothetical protein
VARGLPGEAGAALADAARVAFVDGFAQAGVVAALLAVTVAAGAYLLLPGARRQPARVVDVDVDAPDEGADDLAAVTGLPEPAAPAACPVSGR